MVASPSPFNDPTTQIAFSIFENKGVFALLLGSGLSRAAEIPTGWEITLDLVRRVAVAAGVEEQTDWAAWYRETEGHEPNYSALLEKLGSSPEERRSILHSYIEPNDDERADGKKIATKAHHAIAELVSLGYIRVIVTTNFDRLMENALRERGIEPTVVSSVDALKGAEPITHTQCFILKLHGDYKDARILNTEIELNGYPLEYDALLDRILDEHGMIVCGWSGEWDDALRRAFLRAPNRRYAVYWTTRGKLGDGAQQIVDHRRARVATIGDADGFFDKLFQQTTTLEKSQRQNPIGIEMLVNGTKRFLSKLEHRIQLSDLIDEETRRVIERISSDDLKPHGEWSTEEFRRRIVVYEAATEQLSAVFGVVGRWGDDSHLPNVIDVLSTLVAYADKDGSGTIAYIIIRSYPAVLALTAYCIGLTRSESWARLHRTLVSEISRENREPVRAV